MYTPDQQQKPNSRPSSAIGGAPAEVKKRRRVVESTAAIPKNTMFKPNSMQSALIQKQLSGYFTPTESSKSNSPTDLTSSESTTPNAVESPTPTDSMSNLQIKDEERQKSRQDLLKEQKRIRDEFRKKEQDARVQRTVLEKFKSPELKRAKEEAKHEMKVKMDVDPVPKYEAQVKINVDVKQEDKKKMYDPYRLQHQHPMMPAQSIKPEQPQHMLPVQQPQLVSQQAQSMHQQQEMKAKSDSDDEVMVDEEMTAKNVCIGMVTTDIVVEKSPLILIRDDQYEIVTLESEGKLNTENYSFKVTSRSIPARFYGWVPFKDTKVLGPLVDHRLIWWDAVIPRGKATNTRTPICIILYCRPDFLGTIAKYFETQRLFLKTPPFYNPACRYSNPHQHLLEQQQQQYQQQQRNPYQQYQPNYQAYQYRPENQYTASPYRHNAASSFNRDEQSQKDIESLLSSIPSDVPSVLLKKKKKSKKNKTKKSRNLKADVIDISDSDDDEIDQLDETSSEEEDEIDNSGYVEGLECHLMDHQIKGVSWMIDRENNTSSKGGILADMGLGKTIQTIALIASTQTPFEEEEEKEKDQDIADSHRITLIITPLALIHQWCDEIKSKTEKNKFRVLKHHGPHRTKDPDIFRRYDVVVTTYQVVSSDMPNLDKKAQAKKKKVKTLDDFILQDSDDDDDFSEDSKPTYPEKYTPLKKDHGPLFQVKWYRVVLDEAQFIKNRTTRASLSCASLSSVKRWCLTGTPIQNNVDELFSLLRFLRIQPLSDYATFKKTISQPIQFGDTAKAMSRLKAVLMAVMLRRTKAILKQDENGDDIKEKEDSDDENNLSKKLTLRLPTREKTDMFLEFSENERALYQLLQNKTKETIQSMAGGQGKYMNMLCLLLRLRQACDHPQLILKSIDSDKDALDIATEVNTATDHWSQSQKICELCGRSNSNASSPYCVDCISIIKTSSVDISKASTKVDKVIEILKETREKNPGEKTIIFSQFTSMLDLMEVPLKKHGFKICRYDGSMSSQLRERSLSTIKYDSKCTVMLISLKCGSLGLNLTAANRVILVDIWWNPAVEEQAIDRVHRIGQRLPVYVTRLLIDNTVELKIIKLQEKKAQLSKGALGDGLVKSAKLTASEIKSLFDL